MVTILLALFGVATLGLSLYWAGKAMVDPPDRAAVEPREVR